IFQPDTISRDDGERKDHHISQITTYRSDGAKYVYGIPAYNFKQDERTFAVQDEDYADPSNDKIVKGLVQYAAGDDSKENAKGLDHYFERTVMPAYAHSYLLTEILSADYVDVTGDGPTDDDLGTYTKINYTRTTGDYKWRVPYTNANFNEGLKSVKGDGYGDNKGSYVYGEKELWYIHSIETKNYVAKFYIENRADGYGVQNEQGGFSTDSKTKKLRKIELYSKQELLNSTALSRPALPLKTVHFEYEYSLCKNIDNNILKYNSGAITDENGFPNQGGKLTLKKVYFTYANSLKGQLSPYQFSYDSYNPDYNLKAYDRWGNYKENTGEHPTSEFPYTDQSADSQGVFAADRDASAWHMTGIQLPSGGKINVNYEADDYAYVQNKRAMQMFKVVAVTGSEPGSLPSSDFNKLYNDGTPNSRNYLIFELPNASANISDVGKELFREKDGSEMDTLYFRFKVDLGGALNTEHVWEYVSGYAGIDTDVSETDRYGMFTNGTQKYGWVKLNSIRIKDKIDRSPDVNPISQAAWCFTKMHLPLIAYGQKRLEDGAVLQIVKSIANTLKQLITLPNGFYNQMRIDKKSQVFDVANSFIRLYNPVDKKKGGGCRVKQLTLSDKWHDMTNSNGNSLYTDAEYGQQYDYTIKDAYGNSISSGVASYEPILGGDENPFRKPVPYEILHKWAASDEFYQEEPFGESFFPGASVGYSKVTIKNLQHTNVTHHATGAVVNEFYTAKDFPTITSRTTTDVKRVKSNPLLKLLKIRARDFMTATQGFVIELNDMHGKPKGTYVYAEGKDKPISGVKYIYKTTVKQLTMPEYVDQPIQVGSLDNNMLVMERDGSIKTKMTGVDYDFVTDMHEDETVNRSTGANGNMESFFAGVFPAVICTVLLSFGQERTRFRTAVTTKVINRYGILEETVAYDQGSIVSTKNKMLDAETGEVLLTETKNQFNDPIYSFNYPAHIEYDRMGPAYRNIGVTADANVSNPSRYFVPGDEVEVLTIATGVYGPKAWIKNVGPSLLQAIDKDGMSVDLTGKRLRVIRSGRRNQQSVSIGTIVSKKSPLNDTNGDGIPDELNVNSATAILNADAKEFSEEWGLFCKCGIQEGQPYNPYTKGTRGNWRPFKSYVQLTGRTQDKLNGNTNVREDGIYTSYIPFWKPPVVKNTTDPWQKSVENWQMVSEVSIYSPYGMELENKDALGIYSSAVYGYNNSLPLVVAANAKYKEIAFDSFEDYDFTSCKDDHFSYKTVTPTNDKLMRTKSHTGKTSIKVAPNSELQISKTLISCPEPQ
ncbi:MAG TPA: hypothetical protein VLB84_04865, partial [Bacteroidia bacterium]|nr:hypothetical protein [Bacteroidia bacterium]